MSLLKVWEKTRTDGISAKVVLNPNWQTYRVSLYTDKMEYGRSRYHTTNKQDAIETAEKMLSLD